MTTTSFRLVTVDFSETFTEVLPAREISLRFDLSGDGAQLWSTPEFPMLIQAEFLAPARSQGTGGFSGVRSQVLAVPVGSYTNLLRSY